MPENARDWRKKESKIRKDERKRYKGKRRAKGTLYSMLAALIAFLISLFSGLLGLNPVGLFSDGSGSHSIIKDNSTEVVEEAPIKMADEAEVRIIVDGDGYSYQDTVYDLEGISTVIDGIETDSPIELVDQNALNGPFEEVEKLLNTKGLEYNIVEDYQ